MWIGHPPCHAQVSLATVVFVASQASLSAEVKMVIKQQLEKVANGWTVYRVARQASRTVSVHVELPGLAKAPPCLAHHLSAYRVCRAATSSPGSCTKACARAWPPSTSTSG